MAAIVFEDQELIPHGVVDFDSFHAWLRTDQFPDSGRIDFVAGNIEIDMSPEELFTHGRLKAEIARVLGNLCTGSELMLFVDGTRISSPAAQLSTEPDIVLVSRPRIRSGDLKLVSASQPGRFIEIEGGPDIAVEIVSESSVAKDSVRLPEAHFKAGTLEYWLIDARDENSVRFEILRREPSASAVAFSKPDPAMSWQRSGVMDREFRLHSETDRDGWPEFQLQSKPND